MGGPCGLLAAVQAYVVQYLLFPPNSSPLSETMQLERLSSSPELLREALLYSLCSILWQAGQRKMARVCINKDSLEPIKNIDGYHPDGITEKMMVYTFDEEDKMREFIKDNIEIFEKRNGCGVVNFFYSVIFSRGMDNVRNDFDEKYSTFIGHFGYCTQEMVNLLLTGKSTSNVWDGIRELSETTILKGINSPCDIGFLTLIEHYGDIKVGEYYKQPHYPIYIILSENHYSILFGLKKNINSLPSFDLYYYDQLSRQKEEIRLTIIPEPTTPHDYQNDEEYVPIERTIHTKWQNCLIDWNGIEKIL